MEKDKNCANSGQMGQVIDFCAEKRAREVRIAQPAAEPIWSMEPHICRQCFGRLVSRPHASGLREYHCTNCELTSQDTSADGVCCCGIKIRKRNGTGRSGGPMVDAGVRCIPNPDKTPAFPSAYVASEVVKFKKS